MLNRLLLTAYFLLWSGAGKDFVGSNVLALLPKHYWEHKTRLSEKALSYWHDSDEEPYFNWNGKILYCEDASDYFLNCDTTKIMMSGGSDISIVKDGGLVNKKINGSPIFLLTSATAEPSKELTRRVSIIPLDTGNSQTEKILEFQSKVALEGLPEYNQDLVMSAYLLRSLTSLIPFSERLVKAFPKMLASRTKFDTLLDLIKASAVIHQHTRKIDSKGRVIAQEKDLELALEVFNILFPHRSVSLTHAQKSLLDYLESIKIGKSASELFREVGHHCYTQMGTLMRGLRSLASKGFVDISKGEQDGRACDIYTFILEDDISKISNINSVSKVSKVSKDKEEPKIEYLKVDGKDMVRVK